MVNFFIRVSACIALTAALIAATDSAISTSAADNTDQPASRFRDLLLRASVWTDDSADVEQRRLIDEATSPIDSLLLAMGNPSSKVRNAAANTLEALGRKVRLTESLCALPGNLQAKLQLLLARDEARILKLFDKTPSARAESFLAYALHDDPTFPDEPVVVLGLIDESRKVQVAAIRLAAQAGRPSPAVTGGLLRIIRDAHPHEWITYRIEWQDPMTLRHAIAALAKLRSPHSAAGLLELLLKKQELANIHRQAVLCKLLAASGNKRAIRNLLVLPRDDSCDWSFGVNLETVASSSFSDQVLRALVSLTDQDEKHYRFHMEGSLDELVGFATNQDRETAWKRFETWWKNSRDKEPYASLKPLPVGDP